MLRWVLHMIEYLYIQRHRHRYSVRPNIQGQIGWLSSYGITSNVENSALYWGKPNAGTTRTQQTAGESSLDVYFDASRNNAIYKNDVTTVRPEAFRAYCLIRYA